MKGALDQVQSWALLEHGNGTYQGPTLYLMPAYSWRRMLAVMVSFAEKKCAGEGAVLLRLSRGGKWERV